RTPEFDERTVLKDKAIVEGEERIVEHIPGLFLDPANRVFHPDEIEFVAERLEIRSETTAFDPHLALEAPKVVRALSDFEQDRIVPSRRHRRPHRPRRALLWRGQRVRVWRAA